MTTIIEEGDKIGKVFVEKESMDTETYKQIVSMIKNETVEHARIMPDCHKSKNCCVGFTSHLVDKIVPDATMGSNTNLFLELKTRKYPNAPEINKGTFTVLTETEKISVRAKGRQMSVKYSSNGVNDSWLLGDFRINARKDGMR